MGLIIASVVSFADLRSAIGFSSFAILTYYAIANVAAWTLTKNQRRWPKWMSVAGFIACITVAFSLPVVSILGGVALVSAGVVIYFLVKNW